MSQDESAQLPTSIRGLDPDFVTEREELAALRAVAEAAKEVVDDAGIEFDDERLRYLTVQITREVWRDLVTAVRAEGAARPASAQEDAAAPHREESRGRES